MTGRYLNLGCGARFHPQWENVDMHPVGPGVRVLDLNRKTPYGDASFDAVYHSHLLEHLSKERAAAFLRECLRILKPGGVIRVAVPDLETIARLYLEALARASEGLAGWSHNYDWILLELYDQCVRERSMGETAAYMRQNPIPNWDFVLQRWGAEASSTVQAARHESDATSRPVSKWKMAFQDPARTIRRRLTRLILGRQNWEALQLGLFRRSGETHLWMYDAYSLSKALTAAGFCQPARMSATESKIPGWQKFNLDADPTGQPYKPDSLYMEAMSP